MTVMSQFPKRIVYRMYTVQGKHVHVARKAPHCLLALQVLLTYCNIVLTYFLSCPNTESCLVSCGNRCEHCTNSYNLSYCMILLLLRWINKIDIDNFCPMLFTNSHFTMTFIYVFIYKQYLYSALFTN